MSYNATKTRITAPVSIDDIQQVFGSAETDLGNLIVAIAINKWSKYKPVYSSTEDTVTGQWDETITDAVQIAINAHWKTPTGGDAGATWFKGITTNANPHAYGWVPPTGTDLYTVLQNYGSSGGTENGWRYCPVVGGASCLFRLQDFAGYNVNAKTPETTFSCPNELTIPTGESASSVTLTPAKFQSTMDANPLSQRNYIKPQDVLAGVPNAYWGTSTVYEGFAIVDTQQSKVVVYTTDNSLTISQDNCTSDSGTTLQKLIWGRVYRVCWFYSTVQFSGGFGASRSTSGVKFSVLPFMVTLPFSVVRGGSGINGVTVYVTAINTSGTSTIKISYSITNRNTNNFTFHIYVYNGTNMVSNDLLNRMCMTGSTISSADSGYSVLTFNASGYTISQLTVKTYANNTLVNSVNVITTNGTGGGTIPVPGGGGTIIDPGEIEP